ncbi:MAG TPA: hypothetical protein PKC40_01225 [Saprospiraceae bacterium]|nr:hypothetical protein [Saprospiraceae bacterium]
MKTAPFYTHLYLALFACSFIFQSSLAQIIPDSITFRGLVQSPPFHYYCIGSSGAGMPDVKVTVTDRSVLPPYPEFSQKTGPDGVYRFRLPAHGNYHVEFEKSNYNWGCGISPIEFYILYDALKDKKPFKHAWEYIAADLNGDGLVSRKDMVFIQKLLISLEKDEKMPLHANWVFVHPEDYVAIESLKLIPGETMISYRNSIAYEDVIHNTQVYEFPCVKVGDFTGDCNNCNDDDTLRKPMWFVYTDSAPLILSDRAWRAGESFDLCFRVQEEIKSFYFQSGIRLNPDFFEILDVYTPNENREYFFSNALGKGKIKISWSGEDYEEKTFSKNESVFCVKVKALRSGSTLDNLIAFDDDILENVWIKNTNEFSALSLNLADDDNENVFSKNNPALITNPVSGTFQLEFETLTGEPEAVILQIMDANGNLLLQQSGNATAGANRFENLNLGQFSGLAFYRITSSLGIITSGKLMVR